MASTIGTRSVVSLQFLTPTPDGSTAWITQLQTDTVDQAWVWLDRFERDYPTKRWRWIRTIENSAYPHA